MLVRCVRQALGLQLWEPPCGGSRCQVDVQLVCHVNLVRCFCMHLEHAKKIHRIVDCGPRWPRPLTAALLSAGNYAVVGRERPVIRLLGTSTCGQSCKRMTQRPANTPIASMLLTGGLVSGSREAEGNWIRAGCLGSLAATVRSNALGGWRLGCAQKICHDRAASDHRAGPNL